MRLLLLYLLLPFNTFCQQDITIRTVPAFTLAENKIIYTDSVSAPSFSKGQLFDHAQEWYRHHFESNDNTLTINNLDKGIISGTGIIHARRREKQKDPNDLYFTIDMLITDGCYEYKIYNIHGLADTTKLYYSQMYNEQLYPPAKPQWPEQYRHTMLMSMNTRITKMIDDLKKDMARPLKRK